MERIGLTASEEMSFENVDGRTDDGRRMPVYTISSPTSLRLRLAKKKNNIAHFVFKRVLIVRII